MNKTEFSKALGWKESNLAGRLDALDMLETCGRCGGSGRYSFNQMDGDKCYGCMGRGRTYPTFSAKLVAKVQAKVAAGELDAYLADCRAKNAARAAIAPLVERAEALAKPIGEAYTAKCKSTNDPAVTITSPEYAAQSLANALTSGLSYLGIPPKCDEHMGINEIVSAVKYGKIDYIKAAALVADRVAMLEELVTERSV